MSLSRTLKTEMSSNSLSTLNSQGEFRTHACKILEHISPEQHPTMIRLKLEENKIDGATRISVALRNNKQRRFGNPEQSDPIRFNVDYHILLFDHLKIYVEESKRQASSKFGSGAIRLSNLESFTGDHIHTVKIYNSKDKSKSIGDLKFTISFPDFHQPVPTKRFTLMDEASRKVIRSKSLASIEYSPPEKPVSNLIGLLSAIRATGWRDTSILSNKSAMKLVKTLPRNLTTGDIVTDPEFLRTGLYFLNFGLASYGAIPRKFFGHGTYLEAVVNSSKTTTIKHLGLNPSHMLVWEYKLKWFFSLKPCFFICFDQKTETIHVCIRGTFSPADILSDLNASYQPFMGGHAHAGFIQISLWIRDHYLDKIIGFIKAFQARALVISGHSLGAAIACILTMMIRDTVLDAINIPDFDCFAHAYATPPAISPNLVKQFENHITCWINQEDIVPKLSYGSVMDFKDLLNEAARLEKDKSLSKDDRVRMLREFSDELKLTNKHPRLVIPGKIYFMYKKTKGQYLVEKSSAEYFGNLND